MLEVKIEQDVFHKYCFWVIVKLVRRISKTLED